MGRIAHPDIEALYKSLEESAPDTAVSVIVKLRGELCDIDCLYCYEKRKEAPGGARISVEQIDQLSRLFRNRPLVVELHGGEPLTIGKPMMAAVLDALSRQPTVVKVSMQTNGVLLDEDWLDLFDERYPGLSMGVSLDGDADANAWRVGYDGQPTYPKVARALRMLADRARPVGVIATVTRRSLGRAEDIMNHLAGFSSVNSLSFVPCFDTVVRRATRPVGQRPTRSRELQLAAVSGAAPPSWAVTPEEYGEFVLRATAHWIGSGLSARMKLEPAVSTIRRLRGLGTTFCHFSNLKCDHVFTLYPDGRFGSCDELPWPGAQLGHLRRLGDEGEVVDRQRSLPLLTDGQGLMAKCVSCRYRHTCGGGCVASRLRHREAFASDDAYCDHRMRLVDGVAALVAQPADPWGAWCRRLRWRPRFPNVMRDVAPFLARWDDARVVREPVELRHSAHGNVNCVGEPGVHEAPDLDPRHPQWRAGIEPGIWPLLDVVTTGWGCVTYDSCQGHRYDGLDLQPVGATVGILPRDRREYARIASALCRVTAEAEGRVPSACVVTAGRADLRCATSGRSYPVLDLGIARAERAGWDDYFDALPATVDLLVGWTRKVRPGSLGQCGCPDRDAVTVGSPRTATGVAG
ncbi:radical SAM protein [Plantactinospora sp. B6F1]|uniref:radical SAM/SPASM domain-containing protein n=1 Tax=Plantactinospora sp. B6F1 TaxID=3158971 RepID=UPI0032D8C819